MELVEAAAEGEGEGEEGLLPLPRALVQALALEHVLEEQA